MTAVPGQVHPGVTCADRALSGNVTGAGSPGTGKYNPAPCSRQSGIMGDYSLKQGYRIRLKGEAEKFLTDAPFPGTVAVKPVDFTGCRVRPIVAPGDAVMTGSPLFYDRDHDSVRFTSPVSGTVMEVVRGERRAVESVIISADGKRNRVKTGISARDRHSTDRDRTVRVLLETGLFPLLIQRPFGITANPDDVPRDIFISGFNSGPLSPAMTLIMQGNDEYFQEGLNVLSRLTSGQVNLSIDGTGIDVPPAFERAGNAVLHRFSGPHPAGTVGVQIHHVAPVRNRHDIVWTCSVQSVIWIGRFFLTGRLSFETVVAVAGPGAIEKKYFRTVAGAKAAGFVKSRYGSDTRFISGDVLTGRDIGPEGHVGFRDNLVTLIPEPEKREFLGWFRPGLDRPSMSRSYLSSFFRRGKDFACSASMNGSPRAFVATGIYERVLPMNIYPVFLIKSILAEDVEEMEGLGIYEVVEEDLALCEYIDPSKNDIQAVIRQGISLMIKEG